MALNEISNEGSTNEYSFFTSFVNSSTIDFASATLSVGIATVENASRGIALRRLPPLISEILIFTFSNALNSLKIADQ